MTVRVIGWERARPHPVIGKFAGIAVLVAAWAVAARLDGSGVLLAGPGAVAARIAADAPLLSRALIETSSNAAWGFLLGNLVAIILAATCVLAPRLERTLGILALVTFCLPLVATGPILRIVLGPGPGPQIALAALAVFYTTFLSLRVGLRAVPRSWLDLVRSHGRGALAEMVHVRSVASLPYLISGLRIAAPAAVLGAMIGEFTGAERGLGVLALRSMRALDTEGAWAVAVLAAGVSILAYAVLGLAGRGLTGGAAPVLLSPPPVLRVPVWRGIAEVALAILLVAALWQGLMDTLGLNPFFAKRPGDVLVFLFSGTDADAHRATLIAAYADTLAVTLPGFLAGLAVGVGLACGVVLAPGLGAVAMPLAVAMRSVPIVTTAPLLVLALGRGASGMVSIVAVMVFFPTLVACLYGLRRTPGQVIDIFDTYAAGRWRELLLARLPAMLPSFFAAARMAVPASILAATTAEWLATGTGIGALMALTASTSDYGMLWSATALVATTAAAATAALGAVERLALRAWAPEQIAS